MTVITTAPASSSLRWLTGARRTVSSAAKRATTVATAARSRYRRPALVVASFGCIDAAAYQVALGVGLLVTGLSLFVFEMLGGDGE